MKIAFVLGQTLVQIPDVFETEAPRIFAHFVAVLAVPTLRIPGSIPGLECVLPRIANFYAVLLLSTLLPLFVVALLAVAYWMIPGSEKRRQGYIICSAPYLSVGVLVLYLTLPVVSKVIFSTFECDTFDNGDAFLSIDLKLSCRSIAHVGFTCYACFMVLVYPIGVPLLLWTMLQRRRSALQWDMRTMERVEALACRSVQTSTQRELQGASDSIGREAAMCPQNDVASARTTNQDSQLGVAPSTQDQHFGLVRSSSLLLQLLLRHDVSLKTFLLYTDEDGDGLIYQEELAKSLVSLGLPRIAADNHAQRIFRLAWSECSVAHVVSGARGNDDERRAMSIDDFIMALSIPLELNPRLQCVRLLIGSFRPECWYWELIVTARRLLLSSILMSVKRASAVQLGSGLVISSVAVFVQASVSPFYSAHTNRAALAADITVFLVLFVGIVGMTKPQDLTDQRGDIIGSILVVVCIAVFWLCFYVELLHVGRYLARSTRRVVGYTAQ